jgi:hypothetical protein
MSDNFFEGLRSFVQQFVVVGRCSGSSFLLQVGGGAKEAMLADVVVVVVGCFAVSAASLHLSFHWMILIPL